jgi:hypothetical protein
VMLLRNGGLLVLRVPNGACFAGMLRLRTLLPGPLRRACDIAMAYNNLLGFPYLYGYSAHHLQRLTAPYGFRLLACVADQVVSTPPGQLTWWAFAEESLMKTLFRLTATLWPDQRSGRYRSAPWLDCIWERACTDPVEAASEIRLGVIPVYSPLVFEDTGLDCPGNRWDRKGGFV